MVTGDAVRIRRRTKILRFNEVSSSSIVDDRTD
jgi:hypothetical protein